MEIIERSSYPAWRDVSAASSNVLDPADGIARVMGNRALYLRMLRRFRDDYQDAAARIRAAIDSGDVCLAHRMAHTLTGAAGMVCAPVLHRLAGALEISLLGGAGSQAPAIAALGAALDALLPAIAMLLGADVAAPVDRRAETVAQWRRQRLVAQLAAMLASGDGAAVALVDGSGAMLRAALGEAGFRALALAVNEFDFDAALITLTPAVKVAQARQAAAEKMSRCSFNG